MALKLSVIGTGYLGATHAAAMAKMGFEVIGVDVDPAKIEMLKRGEVPFFEPDLDALLKEQIEAGRLSFSTDFALASDCDIHFICVGTPQMENGIAADLRYVDAAFTAVAKIAKAGSLLVGKSTVPVGTAMRLSELVKGINPDVEVAWNPEFLREGFAVEDTLRPTRLVVGVTSDRAEAILKEVYAVNLSEQTPWIRADLPTAELVKVAANSFLATKISFINAMAEICDASGGDVTVLAKAIGYDPRIGNRFLQAGIGFGGGCLPKDIRAFMARADELGAHESLEFLREIDSINTRARNKMINVVRRELGEDLSGKKIGVLGAAFKPDSDDVRDSPALDIASQLLAAGADLKIHDPKAAEPAKKRFPSLSFVETVDEVFDGAELVLHLTEWKQYRAIDPTVVKSLVKSPIMIDGRNMLDMDLWASAGWRIHAVGRTSR